MSRRTIVHGIRYCLILIPFLLTQVSAVSVQPQLPCWMTGDCDPIPGGVDIEDVEAPCWATGACNIIPDGDDFEREFRQAGELVKREIANCFSGGCDPTVIVRDFDLSSEAVGELGRVLYQAAAITMEERHARSTLYRLSGSQKELLRPYFGDVVDRVAIVYNARLMDYLGSFMGRSLNAESDAQTYGYRIYMGRSYDAHNMDQIVLLGHELVHVLQYEQYGNSLSDFGYHYFRSWARNGFGYSRIAQEEEAFDRQETISGLYIENRTGIRIWVAVGYAADADTWISRGWWQIEPDAYRRIITGQLPRTHYYIYAIGENGRVWSGNSSFWVHPTDEFGPIDSATTPDLAASYGYQSRLFRDIDVGQSRSYKVLIPNLYSAEPDTLSTASSASSASFEALATVNTGDSDRLNIRYGPGTEYAILRQATNGSTYGVAGADRDGNWVALYLDDVQGTYGWVWAEYVDLDRSLSSLSIPYEDFQPAQVAVRYWRAISNGDYRYAWDHLSPTFRASVHNNDFNHFVQGYKSMNLCSVAASETKRLPGIGDIAIITARVTYESGPSCMTIHYNMRFEFIYSSTEPNWLLNSATVEQ